MTDREPSKEARALVRQISGRRAGLLAEKHRWTDEIQADWNKRFAEGEIEDALALDAFARHARDAALEEAAEAIEIMSPVENWQQACAWRVRALKSKPATGDLTDD